MVVVRKSGVRRYEVLRDGVVVATIVGVESYGNRVHWRARPVGTTAAGYLIPPLIAETKFAEAKAAAVAFARRDPR